MILIDSSGWIEFFSEGPRVLKYSSYLKDLSNIVTPTIVVYEVYKKIKKDRTEEEALLAVSLMKKTSLIPLEESIALLAADLSLKYTLPMADAMVYATALEKNAELITSDAHFKDLEKVILIQ
jgi:predicted nucleic acid-binding protein